MCTIGCVNLNHTFLFKNRDPIRGTPLDEQIEKIQFNEKCFLIIKNSQGCYAGFNQEGVGAVGSFVNMIEHQNNYFDGKNLIIILNQGKLEDIKCYLLENSNKFYGNFICSDNEVTYAFELNGNEVKYKKVIDRHIMTNHFQQIEKPIRTFSDEFIYSWTTQRLVCGRELLENVNTFEDIKKLLSDHKNYPYYSICNHGKIPTISSYILDCQSKIILYCKGSPCENDYVEFGF